MEGRRLKRCHEGSALLLFTIKMWQVFSLVGATWILEHPEDPGKWPFPSTWVTEEVNGKSRGLLARQLPKQLVCDMPVMEVSDRMR